MQYIIIGFVDNTPYFMSYTTASYPIDTLHYISFYSEISKKGYTKNVYTLDEAEHALKMYHRYKNRKKYRKYTKRCSGIFIKKLINKP